MSITLKSVNIQLLKNWLKAICASTLLVIIGYKDALMVEDIFEGMAVQMEISLYTNKSIQLLAQLLFPVLIIGLEVFLFFRHHWKVHKASSYIHSLKEKVLHLLPILLVYIFFFWKFTLKYGLSGDLNNIIYIAKYLVFLVIILIGHEVFLHCVLDTFLNYQKGRVNFKKWVLQTMCKKMPLYIKTPVRPVCAYIFLKNIKVWLLLNYAKWRRLWFGRTTTVWHCSHYLNRGILMLRHF